MAQIGWNSVLRHVRRLGAVSGAGHESDAALLEQFAARHDEAAFAKLIDRHGPMVWSVCRRLLPHAADAEDAFQATFLVLVRRAGHLSQPDALGPWLHGVAFRVAGRQRATVGRRRANERPYTDVPVTETMSNSERAELRSLLDEEINRLPERYRVPFVLCYLDGLTNEEAARRLRCPKGTILSRLSRARERLRKRLTRRGIGLSSAALQEAIVAEGRAAPVSASLTESTIAAGAAFASGRAETLPASSTVALAEGVLRNMFLTKVRMAAALLLALTMIGVGSRLLSPAGIASVPPDSPKNVETRALEAKLAPAEKAPPAETAPAKVARRDLELRDALRRVVKSNGWDDPKSTLADVLDQLRGVFNVEFDVNERAFRLEAPDQDVLKTEVAAPPIPPISATLDSILRKVLSRVKIPSGATYLIRKHHIEITTGNFFWAEVGPDPHFLDQARSTLTLGPMPDWFKPAVYEDFTEQPLPTALATLEKWTDVNIVLDSGALSEETKRVTASLHNVLLEPAVRILAGMADLQVVRLDNVLFVTTPEKAARLQRDWRQPLQSGAEPEAKKPSVETEGRKKAP